MFFAIRSVSSERSEKSIGTRTFFIGMPAGFFTRERTRQEIRGRRLIGRIAVFMTKVGRGRKSALFAGCETLAVSCPQFPPRKCQAPWSERRPSLAGSRHGILDRSWTGLDGGAVLGDHCPVPQ